VKAPQYCESFGITRARGGSGDIKHVFRRVILCLVCDIAIDAAIAAAGGTFMIHSIRIGNWLTSERLTGYALVNVLGATLNFAAYACLLAAWPQTAPLLALASGSALSLAFNYLGSRFFAFTCNKGAAS
jgi:hypothetical protein